MVCDDPTYQITRGNTLDYLIECKITPHRVYYGMVTGSDGGAWVKVQPVAAT